MPNIKLKVNQTFTDELKVNTKAVIGAYQLPIVDGTLGQSLLTDGAGTVTWQDVVAGITNLDGGTASSIYLLTQNINGGGA